MGAEVSSNAFKSIGTTEKKHISNSIRSMAKLIEDVAEFESKLPTFCNDKGRCTILIQRGLTNVLQVYYSPLFWKTFNLFNLYKVLVKIEFSPEATSSSLTQNNTPQVVVGTLFEFYYSLRMLNELCRCLTSGAEPDLKRQESKGLQLRSISLRFNEEECPICMEAKKEIVLPDCLHSYCNKCYNNWKNTSGSCPNCRKSIQHIDSKELWMVESWKESDLQASALDIKEQLIHFLQNQQAFCQEIDMHYVELSRENQIISEP